MRVLAIAVAALSLAGVAAADTAPTPTPTATATFKFTVTPTPRGLRGGVLATFDVHGETFRIWVTNPETIDQLFALQRGESTTSIPNGPLRRGPGRAGHNRPWSWHFDPAQVTLADFTIEICDATPSFVEENLTYFIRTVRSYCPWAAVLVKLQDFR